ncbi:MAG: hypothetical protein P8R54_18200 [Myxococcota bacterium]|nr:hypothetical protein [Myxococcota bacterium]
MTLGRLVPMVVLIAPALAAAGEREQAEHTRLSEEMRRLASRNAWRGVEASYAKMLPLERRGVVLTFDDHFIAAQAASNLGDINSTYLRAQRAVAAASNENDTRRSENWIREIESSYGSVELRTSSRFEGASALKISEIPFANDQRAAYDVARATIAERGSYSGLLPLGDYVFGDIAAGGEPFSVAAGGELQKVVLMPPESEGGGLAYAGPRLDLGGAFSTAGDPTLSGAEVAPVGFAGAGLRAGLGFELGTRLGIGALVEVGYHTIGGASSADPTSEQIDTLGLSVADAYGYSSADTSIGMFYGWLAGSYFISPGELGVTFLAGPVMGIGSGTVQGVSGGSESYSDRYSQVNGSIQAGGVSGGVSLTHNKASIGKLGVGLSALGGAQSDTTRWYTWGQAALTITPARSDG